MRGLNFVSAIVFFVMIISEVYAQSEAVTVKVNGIDVEKGGNVKIALYDQEGFLKTEISGVTLEAEKTSLVHEFNDVPVGKYAVAVYQDENSDGRLNKNIFGKPKELYGFSNNKYGLFGPPGFDDVSFELKENKKILIINIHK